MEGRVYQLIMGEKYWVAKLNLSPKIISLYVNNIADEDSWTQLKYEVIPNTFNLFYEKKVNDNNSENQEETLYKFTYNEKNIKSEISSSKIYKDFLKTKDLAMSEYKNVIDERKRKGGIYWPEDYLKTTKIKMRKLLYKLCREYPVLYQIIKTITDDSVIDKIPGDSEYGQGRMLLY